MSSTYECRVGRSRRRTPAPDPGELRYDYRADDGLQSDPVHAPDGWPVLDCPDCARRGHARHVEWWEAGYVPGTRICRYCGSYWDLTTMAAVAMEQEGEIGRETAPQGIWFLRRARFYHG